MSICPECNGSGERRPDFVRFANGRCGTGVVLRCSRCDATGSIPDAMANWIARGRAMRDRRVDACITLRAEAKRRGLTAKELSDMEMGRVNPVEDVS